MRNNRCTSCGRERCVRGISAITLNNTTKGRKHYSVLPSLLPSEPRLSSTLANPVEICRNLPLMSKLSHRKLPSETPIITPRKVTIALTIQEQRSKGRARTGLEGTVPRT